MLLTVAVLPLVARIVRPDLLSITVLLVLKPVAFVASAVCVVVLAEAVGLVILPLAVVDVTVCVNQTTASVGFISPPVALVEGAVDPDLNASSVFAPVFVPLALVLSAVVQSHEVAVDALDAVGGWAWLKIERFERVANLHD